LMCRFSWSGSTSRLLAGIEYLPHLTGNKKPPAA
jgi:hypothetical protein